jgi:hypothetical protein
LKDSALRKARSKTKAEVCYRWKSATENCREKRYTYTAIISPVETRQTHGKSTREIGSNITTGGKRTRLSTFGS